MRPLVPIRRGEKFRPVYFRVSARHWRQIMKAIRDSEYPMTLQSFFERLLEKEFRGGR